MSEIRDYNWTHQMKLILKIILIVTVIIIVVFGIQVIFEGLQPINYYLGNFLQICLTVGLVSILFFNSYKYINQDNVLSGIIALILISLTVHKIIQYALILLLNYSPIIFDDESLFTYLVILLIVLVTNRYYPSKSN